MICAVRLHDLGHVLYTVRTITLAALVSVGAGGWNGGIHSQHWWVWWNYDGCPSQRYGCHISLGPAWLSDHADNLVLTYTYSPQVFPWASGRCNVKPCVISAKTPNNILLSVQVEAKMPSGAWGNRPLLVPVGLVKSHLGDNVGSLPVSSRSLSAESSMHAWHLHTPYLCIPDDSLKDTEWHLLKIIMNIASQEAESGGAFWALELENSLSNVARPREMLFMTLQL